MGDSALTPSHPHRPLLLSLCLTVFAATFSAGAFPATLPELGREGQLADWQLGLVAGTFGLARMLSNLPIGLLAAHRLRVVLALGPFALAAGVVGLVGGGPFPVLVLARGLMGVGHALGMVGGLTAILRYQAGASLASALNAFELSAMLGILGGTVLIGTLPATLRWNQAYLAACAPQLLGFVVLRWLLAAVPPGDPATPRPLFTRRGAAGSAAPAPSPTAGLAFAAGGAVALAYATIEQFLLPLRGARELGLDRPGVARLLMVAQLADILALLPVGRLADRAGTVRVLPAVLLAMAAATLLIGFGTLPWLAAGAVLYGLAMAGWMLPLGALRGETPPERVAWRTALYRVCVDGGLFLGPVLAGALGTARAGLLAGVWAALLALTGLGFASLAATRRAPAVRVP